MENTWTTLYDVSREGTGIMPWFFTGMWLIGICAAAMAIRKDPVGRLFLSFWLLGWCTLGGIGVGNVLYQYGANIHALKSGSCGIVEGPILHFHRQILFRKADSQHFVVNGHRFSYFAAYLGSGLRSSAGFSIPLREGLYVKVWYRQGAICRLDARP